MVVRKKNLSEDATSTHRSEPAVKLFEDDDEVLQHRRCHPLVGWGRPASLPGTAGERAIQPNITQKPEGETSSNIERFAPEFARSDSVEDIAQPILASPLLSSVHKEESDELDRAAMLVDIAPMPPGIHGDHTLTTQAKHEPTSNHIYPKPRAGSEADDGLSFARLLRKVQGLTDQGLMKRTEWRHEYDQLQHCRRWLNASTGDLMAAMMHHRFPELQGRRSADSLPDPSADLWDFPDDTTPLDESSPSPSESETSAKSSGEKNSSKGQSSATDADTRASEMDALANLNRRYLEDYNAVRAQEEKTTRIADELSNLEYQLKIEMTKVRERMCAGGFVTDLKSEIMRASFAPSEGSSQQSEGDKLPEMVEKYFDVKGDIGIFTERLQECDFAYTEGITEREFLRERGDPISPSDEQFDYNYRTRRKEIEQDLKTAQDEVEILRQRCLDAGYQPEEYRTSRHSLHPTNSEFSGQIVSESYISPAQIHEIQLNSLLIPSATFERHSTQKIDSWLRATDDHEGSTQPPVIEPIETPISEDPGVVNVAMKPIVSRTLAEYELHSFDIEAFRYQPKNVEVPG